MAIGLTFEALKEVVWQIAFDLKTHAAIFDLEGR